MRCTFLRSLVAVALFTVFSAMVARAKADDASANQRPLIVLTGHDSSLDTVAYQRIRSAEQWDATWSAHHGKSVEEAFQAKIQRLEIDFSKYEVIAIFQGKGVNSRGLLFESLVETGDAVTLRFDEWHYQSFGGGDSTTAFGFAVIPRTEKHIILEENVQGLKDQPAKWKQQAKLETSE